MLNQFTFRAVDTGTFNGQCTQLCGLYHSLMLFRVKVVPMSDYKRVAGQQGQRHRGVRCRNGDEPADEFDRTDQARQERRRQLSG